ncbi:MAG: YdcF family protein [Actinomycetota bacterium]|nr:YdcF family protein [Actinomycetota bacterium]
MKRAVRILAVLIVAYGAFTFLDVWLTSRRTLPTSDASVDPGVALVLGAAQYNGEPSPVLRQRLDLAVLLFQGGAIDKVVVTGGGQAGDATTEAKASYDYLRAQGLPDQRLLLEVQGTSTYESLAAAHRFLAADGINEVVLVTDRYHARRSLLVAEEVGFDAEVALTEPGASMRRLIDESAAVAVGRIIGFRRLERLVG